MTAPPPVRDATRADAAACLAIYRPFVTDTAVSFETEPPGEAAFAERIRRAQATHAWLVADADGAVAGYAYATPHRSRAAYRFTTETSVYVAEGQRGRGVGRALYGALFARLAALGYVRALAGIALPNAASVALHEAVGFEPVGVYPAVGFKQGAWHDVGWWHRTLAAGPPTIEPPTEPPTEPTAP